METIAFEGTFPGWQQAARDALVRGLPPEAIFWQDGTSAEDDLFGGGSDSHPTTGADNLTQSTSVLDRPNTPHPAGAPLRRGDRSPAFPSGLGSCAAESRSEFCGRIPGGEHATTGPVSSPPKIRVPREFLESARTVACHRSRDRWALLYRMLWRLTHGEPQLLAVAIDPDVIALNEHAKAVRRDIHKMRAFVRFRETTVDGQPWYVAWFEPHHAILEANAKFFVDRFAHMNWSILTPDRCMHWDQRELGFSPGVSREHAPAGDVTEDLWRAYYGSIFNPARVKIGAMTKEMPRYYWKNLPEAVDIPDLLEEAAERTAHMVAASHAKVPAAERQGPAPVPDTDDLDLVREAAKTCRACPLWQNATCTVFGEGPRHAHIVVVGEQPGDQEDLAGRPFVGPAGQLWNRALTAAGIDRGEVYVTNAVKHFKWKPQGKRRLHQKPSAREIAACRPWLQAELKLIRPQLIVCLGGTAAQAVIGTEVRVLEERGRMLATEFGTPALITVHPSALLRQPDPGKRETDFTAFVADLAKIRTGGSAS